MTRGGAGGTSGATIRNIGQDNRRALHRSAAIVVVVLGLTMTAAFGLIVAKKQGVYFADSKLLFLAPRSAANPNNLVTISGGLIVLAGTVGRMVEHNVPAARVVSPSVTIAEEGIRNGYSVTLPDDGGQWGNNFDQQLLDVQVVGPTAVGVAAKMQSLLNSINDHLTALQDQAYVAVADRVTTSPTPARTDIYYLAGRRSRALAATAVVGLALTVAAFVFVRRFGGRIWPRRLS